MAVTPPLAVLGATGYLGGLVCAEARKLGLPLRLVGRRREALEERARDGEEVSVADASSESSLRDAFDGAFAVLSCAGPFLDTGPGPVAAAIAAGAHYLDPTPEQAFARIVYERFGETAAARGVTALTAFGFDFVPGDVAARLAAEGLEEPLDEVVVGYALYGTATSAGTRRTMATVMKQPQVAYENGIVPSRFGATTRKLRFPRGEASVVEWGGAEPLTVPRHTRVRSVRSYIRAPRIVAAAGRIAPLAAPLVRATGHIRADPSERYRGRARFAVVAEARSGARGRRVTITGHDVYATTALLLAQGADALRRGEARRVGALAPAEAFDARALLERAHPFLNLAGVDEL